METVKEVLRSQYDGRKYTWRIVKKTYNGSGGWAKFGSAKGYISRKKADAAIDRMVQAFPDMYMKEQSLK